MPRPSRAAIESRLARMAKEIEAIEATLPATLDEFLLPENETLRTALEHRIFVACQAMLDIAGHIIASRGFGAPATYQEALDQLAHQSIVPRDVIEAVSGAAGLRNAIAHLYLTLNQEQLFSGLHQTTAMKRFAAAVWEWMERQ